ncbi:hypothetical protein ACC691_16685 [Rhizobium johnstonii]|uniref:hypothetical protein n=1 Tax=Rhizobium johnstonii TaxID=3019933 RepID=UPI003F99B6A8
MAKVKLSLSTADMRRIARAAKASGLVFEYVEGDVTVRFVPVEGAKPATSSKLAEDRSMLDRGLDAPPEPIKPPFDHREWAAMARLVELGTGARLPSGGIRSFGPVTQKKLLDRGYIEVFHQSGEKFADDEICLTRKGNADWNALRKHRACYPAL